MGVTINVASVEPTELAYERAYDEHWPDVFRFALAWTNDWAPPKTSPRSRTCGSGTSATGSTGAVRRCRGCSSRPAGSATDRFRQLRRRLAPPPPPESLNDAVHARWLDVGGGDGALTPIERSALVMTAIEGLPYEEAAASSAPRPGPFGRP